MGHWNKAPKIVIITINKETSKFVKPLPLAYTAPKPNKALCENPISNAPINPNGDIWYNSENFILFGFSKFGALVEVSKNRN